MQTASIATLEWTEFLRRFRWQQGEHLVTVGPTGSGKTTLLLSLLFKRRNVAIFATKPYPPKDEIASNTLATFAKNNHYLKLPQWTPANKSKIVLWPSFKRPGDELKQHKVFKRALLDIFVDRGWCIAADEIWYHTNRLGLQNIFETYLSQGRELGLTVAAATQRPSHISLMFYSEPKHFFFFKLNNPEDRKRIAQISDIDAKYIMNEVAQLPKHTFLYVNPENEILIKSKAPKL